MTPDVAIAVRVLTAWVFLSAALGKLRNFAAFQGVLANYRLLPEWLLGPAVYALPLLELSVGFGVLAGWRVAWFEIAGASLLTVFAAAMAINLLRGRRDIDCGCFQHAFKQVLRWRLVIRNGVLTFLLSAAAATVQAPLQGVAAINAVAAGTALFVVLQCLNMLWAVPRPKRSGRLDRPQAAAMLGAPLED